MTLKVHRDLEFILFFCVCNAAVAIFLEDCSERSDEFLVGVGVGTVAGLQICKTVEVVFLGKGVGSLFCHYDIVSETEGICGGVAYAHVGVKPSHDDSLDAKFLEENVEISLEEAAVAPFRYHVILVAEIELRYHLGSLSSGYGVVAPDLQFAVDARAVCIIAENYWYSRLAGSVEELCGSRDDCFSPVASKCSGHEVVKHVDYENRRFVKFVHSFRVLKIEGANLAIFKK